MGGIVIEDEAWRRIMADEQLRRARSRLSFHEIRLIVQHVRDASGDDRNWVEGEPCPPHCCQHCTEKSDAARESEIPGAGRGNPQADEADVERVADPEAELVASFSAALLAKLRASEQKYGWNRAWMRPDWRDDLSAHLCRHVEKGDPIDVAAYCAFAFHHGWPLTMTTRPAGGEEVDAAKDIEDVVHDCLITDLALSRAGVSTTAIRAAAKDIGNHFKGRIITKPAALPKEGEEALRHVQSMLSQSIMRELPTVMLDTRKLNLALKAFASLPVSGEVERLRAALEPLAAIAREVDDFHGPDFGRGFRLVDMDYGGDLTIDQCRTARAALTPQQATEEGV